LLIPKLGVLDCDHNILTSGVKMNQGLLQLQKRCTELQFAAIIAWPLRYFDDSTLNLRH
jgi:hypothetical protein